MTTARDILSPTDKGAYQCRCGSCGEQFVGYKRSFTCALCTGLAPDAANAGEAAADLALAAETYLIAVDGFEDACRVDGETPGGADELYETAKDNLAKARATLEAEIFAARKAGK